MPRKAQYLAFCLLLSSVISSCSQPARSEQAKGIDQSDVNAGVDNAVTVSVARVERKDLFQGLMLAAEFRPFQEIDLHAKVAGYLREINVDVGDRVKQGQVIATLEIPEFKSELLQAEATKRRSESDVVRARSELQRAQSVYDAARLTHSRLSTVGKSRPNLLAQQEVDDALAKLQVAEAQLNAAKAAISVAEEQVRVQEANEARVKTLASYTVISAPFSGVITKRLADKGALIQQGASSQTQAMPVVRLSQIDHLRLALPVPESVVPRIRRGRIVKVKVPSLNQTFDGKVSRFAEKVETSTRTMATEVDVPNPRSILRKENKATVMLVNARKRLELREIVTGMETPDSVEILSGLSADELVVIGNLSQLKPGQLVETKERNLRAEKGEN